MIHRGTSMPFLPWIHSAGGPVGADTIHPQRGLSSKAHETRTTLRLARRSLGCHLIAMSGQPSTPLDPRDLLRASARKEHQFRKDSSEPPDRSHNALDI